MAPSSALVYNLLYIGLGLVVAVSFYFAYVYLLGDVSSSKAATLYLKTLSAPYLLKDYTTPGSQRSCYSFWLNVINLNATSPTPVFVLSTPNATGTPVQIAKLQLSDKAELVFIKGTATANKSYTLAPSFPMQKWTRCDLSFDNSTFDFYMDGKLMRSFVLESALSPAESSVLQFAIADAYLFGFDRKAEPTTPAKAQADYLAGQKKLTGWNVPKYGVSMSLTKNDVVAKNVSIF